MLELSVSESESTVPDSEKKDVLCNELGRTALQGFKEENNKGIELRFTSDVDDTQHGSFLQGLRETLTVPSAACNVT